jgi:hypothetical protein
MRNLSTVVIFSGGMATCIILTPIRSEVNLVLNILQLKYFKLFNYILLSNAFGYSKNRTVPHTLRNA